MKHIHRKKTSRSTAYKKLRYSNQFVELGCLFIVDLKLGYFNRLFEDYPSNLQSFSC